MISIVSHSLSSWLRSSSGIALWGAACFCVLCLGITNIDFPALFTRTGSPFPREPSINLGDLATETVSECIVNIGNKGPGSIIVAGVYPECGCTTLQSIPIRQTVTAGGQISVPVRLAVGNAEGPLRKRIIFRFENAVPDSVEVTLTATVNKALTCSPAFLNLGVIQSNESVSRVINITEFSGRADFSISRVDCGNSYLKSLPPEKNALGGYSLTIMTVPPLDTGRHKINVCIEADSDPRK